MNLKRITTIASAAVVALGATLGIAQAQAGAPPVATRSVDGDMAADLAAVLRVEPVKVQAILDAARPTTPTGRPQRDDTALVRALASGLKLEGATVVAALDKTAGYG
jgi:hypothetical protein